MARDNLTESIKRMLRLMISVEKDVENDANRLADLLRNEQVPIQNKTLILVNNEIKSWVDSDRELNVVIKRLTGHSSSTFKGKKGTGELKQQIIKNLQNSNQTSRSTSKKVDKLLKLVRAQKVSLDTESYRRISKVHSKFNRSWLRYIREIERLKMRQRQNELNKQKGK